MVIALSLLCGEVGTEPHGSAAAWGLSPSVWGSFVQWNIFGVFMREHLTRMGKFGENVPDAVRIGGSPPHVGKLVIAMSTRPAPSRFSPHVGKLGRTKRGQFSVRDALRPCGEVFERVSLHAGCVGCSVRVGMFCRGSGGAAVKGIIPPTAGKDGGDGYRIAAGRHPAGTASAVPGSPGNPFFGRSACRIYCRRRRGGMRWARHLPY